MYTYIWSRPAPSNPPQCYPPSPPPATTPTGVASHLPPSVKISYAHMLYLHAGLVPPMHYITGYQNAVFTAAYNMPIQSVYKVLLPVKYLDSSHILPIHYLHDTSITPHTSHRGGVGVSYSYTFNHSINNVFLPKKYLHSSHILATIKISCAIHTCWPRITYTLSTWYLYNTPPIPQGGVKETLDGSFTCWAHTTYLLPYALVAPVTHYLDPTHPTGGRG